MEPEKNDPNRLTRQETLLMHMQNELEQMHSVILSQQDEFKALQDRIVRLESRIEEQATTESPTSLEDERPPHY